MPKKIATKTTKPAAAKAPTSCGPVRYIGFIESLRNFVKRTFDFKGTSTRAEYWWPFLVVMLIGLIPLESVYYGLFVLAFVPSLSVEVRRLHDTGRTGWFAYILAAASVAMVVFTRVVESLLESQGTMGQLTAQAYLASLLAFVVMAIWMIVLCALPSKTENNKYRK
ncbi:MAG: DUF805 domain-containing protein [Rickettsiales bacterium]|jgi:uncharacterized membrane protein YhaH (DUF805 family)|nr:DUF805 domain-containing protein [Rickettsiales bacterium]